MRRGRIRRGHQTNPFVVFTDLTIALAIIFLVFGIGTAIANNQILLFFNRNDRQKTIEADLSEALMKVIPGATAKQVTSKGDTRPHIEIRHNATLVAEVWTNSSFQRVRILKSTFSKGSEEPNEFGKQSAASIALVIKKHAPEFSYLFLHGITESREAESMSSDQALTLSTSRARKVLRLLEQNGAVGDSGVPKRFGIPYGTGADLYTTESGTSGRVDLIFFFNDLKDKRS